MGLARSVLWWSSVLLLTGVLCRMTWAKLLARYPLFSAYLALALSQSAMLLCLQPVTSNGYRFGYWVSEFVCALLAFGVTWEIYAQTLAPYPGVRKMARTLMGVLLVAVGAKTMVQIRGNPLGSWGSTVLDFERDLRVVQMFLLLGLVALVVHYGLPVGRNTLAVLMGYGFYLGFRVVSLTVLTDLGLVYHPVVSLALQGAWNLAVIVWCVGMWSYAGAAAPDAQVECDYERASEQTIRAMGQLRNHLVHSLRSS